MRNKEVIRAIFKEIFITTQLLSTLLLTAASTYRIDLNFLMTLIVTSVVHFWVAHCFDHPSKYAPSNNNFPHFNCTK